MNSTRCFYANTAGYMPSAAACAMVTLCCGIVSDVKGDGGSRRASCSGEPDRRAGVRRKRDIIDPVSPCAKFNSLQWRMSYASRKEECNALDSCVFIGRAITGACASRDPSLLLRRGSSKNLPNVPLVLPEKDAEERKAALQRHHAAKKMEETIDELETEFQKEKDEQLAARRFQELMDPLDVEEATQERALAILREEGMAALQVFVQSQLANAAAEELRCQKASTKAFAKDFLIQVLQNEELPGHFGKMLRVIFQDPSLATGVRQLIYAAISLDHTFTNSFQLTRNLVTWLLTGTDWMDEQALGLCVYLVGLPETELAASWLVAWAISKPGILDLPASKAVAQSLPLGSQEVTKALTTACASALQSEWAQELAKATTLTALDMLQRSANKNGTKQSLPTEAFHVATEGDEAEDRPPSATDVVRPQQDSLGGNEAGRRL